MTSRVIDLLAVSLVVACMLVIGPVSTAVAEELDIPPVEDVRQSNKALADDLFGKGLLRLNHGDESGAIKNFEKVVALDPDSYNTRLLLGKLYTGKKRWKDAENTFRAAIKRRPDDFKGYDLLISLLLFTRKPAEAVQVGEQALQNGVEDRLILDLGWAYYQAGMFEKAEARYKKELEFRAKEDLFAPHRNLGILYFAKGDYENALEEYQKAEDLGNEPKEVPFLVAMVYDRLGLTAEAFGSITVFKARTKDYAKLADRYLKKFFPHTETPNMSNYIFSVSPEAKERIQEEKRKQRNQ